MTDTKVFDIIKEEFNNIPEGERSVEMWNNLRIGMKDRFPKEAIKLLDSSGFIVLWLGDKAIKGKNRVNYYRK